MTGWRKAMLVFGAMVALDITFALYVVMCAEKRAVEAGLGAAAIQVFNIFVVTSFVKDSQMRWPCIAGAFVGTWLAIVWV